MIPCRRFMENLWYSSECRPLWCANTGAVLFIQKGAVDLPATTSDVSSTYWKSVHLFFLSVFIGKTVHHLERIERQRYGNPICSLHIEFLYLLIILASGTMKSLFQLSGSGYRSFNMNSCVKSLLSGEKGDVPGSTGNAGNVQ